MNSSGDFWATAPMLLGAGYSRIPPLQVKALRVRIGNRELISNISVMVLGSYWPKQPTFAQLDFGAAAFDRFAQLRHCPGLPSRSSRSERRLVGEAVPPSPNNIKSLPEGAGKKDALSPLRNFRQRPHLSSKEEHPPPDPEMRSPRPAATGAEADRKPLKGTATVIDELVNQQAKSWGLATGQGISGTSRCGIRWWRAGR
jgi:hypothetical protein